MAIQEKIKSHPDVINYFKELSFYNTKIEKPKIKRLSNIDLLPQLLFYKELYVVKTDKAFGGYAVTYNVELIDEKDPLSQLEAIRSNIKDLLNDFLGKTKGFKYQITVTTLLKNTKALKLNFSILFQFNNINSDKS